MPRPLNRPNQNFPPVTFIAPTGEHFTTRNLCQFARTHDLTATALCGLLRGRQLYHRGWRLSTTPAQRYHTVIAPDGARFTRIANLSEFSRVVGIPPLSTRIRLSAGLQGAKRCDEYGRAWHLLGATLYTFRDVNTGAVYDNVINPGLLGRKLGISAPAMRHLVTGATTTTQGATRLRLTEVLHEDSSELS